MVIGSDYLSTKDLPSSHKGLSCLANERLCTKCLDFKDYVSIVYKNSLTR